MGAEEQATEVAKSALDAYKTSPLLTGLLALNLVFLIGFGWFLTQKNQQHESLVARIIDEESQFREQLLQAALACTHPAISAPLTTGKPGYLSQPTGGNF